MSGFEMFCERCGTRYGSEEASAQAPQPLARRLLTAVGVTAAPARPTATDPLLRFCLACRGYTCPDCWNNEAGFCQTCVPLPEEPAADHVHIPTVNVPAFGEMIAAEAAVAGLAGVEPAADETLLEPPLATEPGVSQPVFGEPVVEEPDAAAAAHDAFDSDAPISLLDRLEPWAPSVPPVDVTEPFLGQPRIFDPALVDPLVAADVADVADVEAAPAAIDEPAAATEEAETVSLFEQPREPDFEPWIPEPVEGAIEPAFVSQPEAEPEPQPEPVFAESRPEPDSLVEPAREPVLAEAEPIEAGAADIEAFAEPPAEIAADEPWAPEEVESEAAPAFASEVEPELEHIGAEPEPQPEAVLAEGQPEHEPIVDPAAAEREYQPEPVLADSEFEPEIAFAEAEPVLAEAEPAPAEQGPEPVAAEPEPVAELEPIARAAFAPTEVETYTHPGPELLWDPTFKTERMAATPDGETIAGEPPHVPEPPHPIEEPAQVAEPAHAVEPVHAAAAEHPADQAQVAEPEQVAVPEAPVQVAESERVADSEPVTATEQVPAPPPFVEPAPTWQPQGATSRAPEPALPEPPTTPAPVYRPLPPLGPIVPPPPPPPTVTPRIEFDIPQTPPAYVINQQHQPQSQPLAARPQLPPGLFDSPGPAIRPCSSCDLPVSAKARFCRRCGSPQPLGPA